MTVIRVYFFFAICESSLLRTNHSFFAKVVYFEEKTTVPYKGACSTQRQRERNRDRG